MELIVRTGKGHSMNSEAYTLVRIIVDPTDGITFECLNEAKSFVTVRPPRLIRDATVEIEPTHYDDSGNFGDALRKGIVK